MTDRPTSPPGFLHRLAALRDDLSPAERRVADFVLTHTARVPRMNLASLAAEAGVSEPTAIRFARSLGCDGIPDLKIRVAQSLAAGAPYVHAAIDAADGLEAIADKVFASSVDTLQTLRRLIDMDAIARAVDAIAGAGRIDFIGNGLSGVAARDAEQKFMRLGVPTMRHGDTHLQRMSVVTLTARDVAVVFSWVSTAIRMSHSAASAEPVRVMPITVAPCARAISAVRTMSRSCPV